VLAALDRSRIAASVLAGLGLLPAILAVRESGLSMAALRSAITGSGTGSESRRQTGDSRG
jgi:hypothetical protein